MGEKVVLNSVENYFQVYLLYSYEMKKSFDELSKISNSNEAQENDYLTAKRKKFYESLGLTEDEFNQYSTDHADEIQSFLEKNPAYKKAYEDSLLNSNTL